MQILLQILAYNNLVVIVFCTLYTFHQSLFTVSYKSLTQFSQNSSQTQNDFKLQYNSICIVQEGNSFNLIKNRQCLSKTNFAKMTLKSIKNTRQKPLTNNFQHDYRSVDTKLT